MLRQSQAIEIIKSVRPGLPKTGIFAFLRNPLFSLFKISRQTKRSCNMPFFLIGALDYKLELVYVFIKLGCILVCFFNFWILIEGVSSPLFCVKVLCNCVNTETRVIVRMLEINSSCYQVTRAEILLTLSHLSLNCRD